jgi:phage gpG-like protein
MAPRRSPETAAFIAERNRLVKESRSVSLVVTNLTDTQKVLRRVNAGLAKELRRDIRQAAKPVLEQARQFAPHDSGRLARSLRISATTYGVGIGSRLPYSNVAHWGGSTGRGHQVGRPWSGSVKVKPALFISRALERREDEVLAEIGDAIDRAFVRAGW